MIWFIRKKKKNQIRFGIGKNLVLVKKNQIYIIK